MAITIAMFGNQNINATFGFLGALCKPARRLLNNGELNWQEEMGVLP